MTPIELVVLDMAGTTVADDGIVEAAFLLAAERSGLAEHLNADDALQYVRDTMGQSKYDVFLHLADGDVPAAHVATAAFEGAYAELIAERGVQPIDGAEETLRTLRDAGIAVVLTTGFSPATRDAILDRVGWRDVILTALSPSDVGRGRPAPDLVLGAAIRAAVSSVRAIAVVGDTASDVQSGLNAGAGLVVGVLTGAHDRDALVEADLIIDSVADLPHALGVAASGDRSE